MASFLNGLYYGNTWFSEIPKAIFMDNYKKFLEKLINQDPTLVKIACLKDEEDVILGYSILGNQHLTIHWVFVKDAWRHGGIAKRLTPKFPTAVTHLTRLGKSLMKKIPTAVYNPFAH